MLTNRPFVIRRSPLVILAAIVLTLAQVACVCGGLDLGLSESSTVKETVSGDWINVYFTGPRYPDDDAYHHGGLDKVLASAIEQTEASVDLVAYDFNLERVAELRLRKRRAASVL